MKTIRIMAALAALGLLTTGCLVQRTVKDSHGNVIMEDTVVEDPFESNAEKVAEIREEERQLGW